MLWLVERRLRSRNPSKRTKAVESLCALDSKRALCAFRRALTHSNPEIRRAAISGLCKVQDPGSAASLLKALQDKHVEVVKAAIVALRKKPTPEVQKAVALLLRHKDAGVRGTAAEVLTTMGWQPKSPEEQAWYLVARGSFIPAADYGTAAIPALELVIANGPYNLSVRAVEALGGISSPQIPEILLRTLNSQDPGVCTAAIDALGRCGGPEIVKPVSRMLTHGNAHVRAIAAEVVGRARGAQALEPLMKLTRDPQWDVRRAAVEALGRIRDKKATGAVIRGLADSDQDVREAAARALGNLRERKAVGPLVLALCDKDTSVRRITAASLSRILEDWGASPEAFAMVDKIKPFLQDSDQEVRRRAADLLASLMAAQQGRSTHTTENRTVALALLLQIIRDADADLRLASAEALSRMADPQAQPALEQAAKDPDRNVRVAAERGLVLLGLKSSTPPPLS